MTEQAPPSAGGLSPGWRRFWTILLGVLFVVIFLAFLAGLVIRRDVLDPALYSNVLRENDAYERVYRDVLADPSLQQSLADAIGIQSNLISGELYAELVSGLNLILPPPRMEAAVDRLIGGLTGYLAGDTAEMAANLDLGQNLSPELLAERIVNTVQAAAVKSGQVAGTVAQQAAPSVGAALKSEEVTGYLEKLRDGALVPLPPSVQGTAQVSLTPTERQQLETELNALPAVQGNEQVQLQIEGALADDDVAGALSLAGRSVLRDRIVAGLERWETQLAQSDALNSVSATAKALGQTQADVLNTLNLIRSYAILVRNLLIPLALLLALLLGLIVWLNSNDLRSMLRSAGWTLMIAGGLTLLLLFAGGLYLRSALGQALAGQPLPAGADLLVDDIAGGLVRALWGSVWGMALFWTVVGAVALLFGYSRQLLSWLRRVLTPIWPYRGWVLGGLLAVFVLLPLMIGLFTAPARAANRPCNGHAELCDRPLNEVVFPTSHNSMSISQYGWLWPSHDGTILDQLDAGIRALLIDTHYWDTQATVENTLAQLSPELKPVAEKALNQLGITDRDGTYLCHMSCGLGYSSLEQTLADINTWLTDNPREVLFLVIQDAISPVDTEAVFQQAGLDKYLFTHKPGASWPTLRQMIDANQRLVVMAEEDGPPPDWYQNVWDNTMETPYTFINYDDFTCTPNRGGDDKPFFLMNHWIQRGSPNRVDASIVNAYDVLLQRARQCEQERGKVPNFVAVNFYQNGDLFRVVDELNGVATPQPAR